MKNLQPRGDARLLVAVCSKPRHHVGWSALKGRFFAGNTLARAANRSLHGDATNPEDANADR